MEKNARHGRRNKERERERLPHREACNGHKVVDGGAAMNMIETFWSPRPSQPSTSIPVALDFEREKARCARVQPFLVACYARSI